VVVILIGVEGTRGTALGQALAAELGWPFENASIPRNEIDRAETMARLRATVSRARDRREHLVLSCQGLAAKEADPFRGLRNVRLVQLAADAGPEPRFSEVIIDGARPTAAIVAAVRAELGI
jgi:gluconate kinase